MCVCVSLCDCLFKADVIYFLTMAAFALFARCHNDKTCVCCAAFDRVWIFLAVVVIALTIFFLSRNRICKIITQFELHLENMICVIRPFIYLS